MWTVKEQFSRRNAGLCYMCGWVIIFDKLTFVLNDVYWLSMACDGFKVDYIIIAFWRVSSYFYYRLCAFFRFSCLCQGSSTEHCDADSAIVHGILTNSDCCMSAYSFLGRKNSSRLSTQHLQSCCRSVMLLYTFTDIALFWHYCWYEVWTVYHLVHLLW